MGKLFWYGMAGLVVALAGFWLTAVYMGRHPDSVFVRYGRAALPLGMDCDPILQVGQTVIQEAGRVVFERWASPELEEATPCVPDDPQPIDEAIPAEQQPLLLIDHQVIEAIREQLPPIPFERDEEPPLADGAKIAATPESPLAPEPPLAPSPLDADLPMPPDLPAEGQPEPSGEQQPPAGAESENPSSAPESSTVGVNESEKMPRCYDDDEDVPSRMPRAEDFETPPDTDALFRFWLDLFRSSKEDLDGQEESEAIHEEALPPCQEDPAYQYQYPGCPFTGKYPVEDRPKLKHGAPLPETKQKKRSMIPDFDPNSLPVPERLKRLLPQADSEEEEEGLQPPPNVDTTEFRPSDAKPGEFEPKPM
jgi:hypothetical protein